MSKNIKSEPDFDQPAEVTDPSGLFFSSKIGYF